ncbi:unnamed protein product [Darwinula stevensoni]|uniref:Uncharacterized protein n=1 Tax=Darwinula stevensoni TaxID=69355 RepID=A0A7R9ABC0_9CRUS|nr:unnamed protein product [Darwinula stevensoni]CAG0899277.1 unnamed protein product [Darwinula stevensoni]
MSKSALVSFADCLRREMKKWNVSVHTIEPTIYKTPLAAEKGMKESLDKLWEACPKEIQDSYGKQYFLDFQSSLSKQMGRAKPESKIPEVINDMVDAAAGEAPQMRYVPSVWTQFRARIISSLPMDLQDAVLCQASPQTPPAAVAAHAGESRKFSALDRLRNRGLRRYATTPAINSNDLPKVQEVPPAASADPKFKF